MFPPTYNTGQYVLKPYSAEDEDRFIEISLDKLSVLFMGGANGIEDEERALFKKGLHIYDKKYPRWFWIWGIYRRNKLIGHLELKESEHTLENELEIVYMVHPEERGKGVMSEVLQFLKKNQKLWNRQIIATVSEDNTHSISLLKKWGIVGKTTLTNPETGEKYLKITLESNLNA